MPRHSFRRRQPRAAAVSNEMIFGRNPVLEAIRGAPTGIDRLYVADGVRDAASIVADARSLGLAVEVVARDVLDDLASGGNHQGVVARIKPVRLAAIEDLVSQAPAMVVVLDGILDPQNLGAIIRAAEVLGAGGVVIPKDRSATVTSAAIRASSGAALHLPIAQVVNVVRSLEQLKEAGYWVVGLDAAGSSRFQDLPRLERVALVIGGEGRGMRSLVERACDFVVAIPVRGRVASLNAASAAAIGLHELAERMPLRASDPGIR